MEDHLANSIAAAKAKFSGFWKQASVPKEKRAVAQQ